MTPGTSVTTMQDTSSRSDFAYITVVVPVRNEEGFIRETLDGLLGQDYPADAFEVLVVDGESTDGTPRIVRDVSEANPNVKLLSNPGRWSSCARNIGIEAALGEVIIVVDGHCQFEDDQYLREVHAAFSRSDIDCLGRPQPLDIHNGTVLQQAIAIARSSRLGHHPDSFIYSKEELVVPAHSVAVAYRKSVFEKVGKFDEHFDAAEDVELNHRVDKAGLKCLLAPRIRLKYHPRGSLSGLAKQMQRYGRGRVRLLRKHPDTFSLKSLAPAGLFFFTLVGGLVSLFSPLVMWGWLAVMALYGGIIATFSVAMAVREKKIAFLWLLPLVFGAIHFGAGYGLLRELIFGRSGIDPKNR